jgi:hypothetical protein
MTLRVLLTMSRTWREWSTVRRVFARILEEHPGALLIHGDAKQGDRTAAGIWVSRGGLKPRAWPADWKTCAPDCPPSHRGMGYCPQAGLRRNSDMVDNGGALLCLAFIRNGSGGATDCYRKAVAAGIETVPYAVQDEEAA